MHHVCAPLSRVTSHPWGGVVVPPQEPARLHPVFDPLEPARRSPDPSAPNVNKTRVLLSWPYTTQQNKVVLLSSVSGRVRLGPADAGPAAPALPRCPLFPSTPRADASRRRRPPLAGGCCLAASRPLRGLLGRPPSVCAAFRGGAGPPRSPLGCALCGVLPPAPCGARPPRWGGLGTGERLRRR